MMRISWLPSRVSLAVLALVFSCSVSHAGDAVVGYSWRMWAADESVDRHQPEVFESVPHGLLDPVVPLSKSDFVNLTGPAQTSADIVLRGRVDLLARSLGIQVSAHAKVNPYDPQSQSLLPILLSAEATVQAGFSDRVVMFDPGLGLGDPIRFKIQPLRIGGRMDVNPESTGAGGTAIFSSSFELVNVTGISLPPVSRSFEHVIVSGGHDESSWDASAVGHLMAMPGGVISVPNGSVWDVDFSIRAAVQALPSMLPASNPTGALSEANFYNTVYWGGLYEVVDANGQPLPNFTMQSELGFDWVSSVPEPSHALLLLAGLGVVAASKPWTRAAALRT